MKKANYAPMYCALYPQLAEIARQHGYALAIHGSLGRDMDLICVPWADVVSKPRALVDAITSELAVTLIGDGPGRKSHGREAWTISVGFGECAIDLSFTPVVNNASDPLADVIATLKLDAERLTAPTTPRDYARGKAYEIEKGYHTGAAAEYAEWRARKASP